jgi:hypothetical protein
MVGAAREVVIATLAAGWKREVPNGMGWGHKFNRPLAKGTFAFLWGRVKGTRGKEKCFPFSP